MDDSDVGGMVRSGAWCDDRLRMEVLSIGRGALDREDSCTMELAGRQLFVRVILDEGWIWVHATSMDEGDAPQLLFKIGDDPTGWTTIRRLFRRWREAGSSRSARDQSNSASRGRRTAL